MNEDGARFDSRFDGGGPFRDTPEAGGISLESALNDFGPAALDDLIPRIRALAQALDAAHEAGAVHGALHPSKVIITDDATTLIAGEQSTAPYVAPEVADGEAPTPAADQFALAAITYQWLFGRPVTRSIDVRSMPGVDRGALTEAFTRALSPEPSHRFASCAAFCDALAKAVVPELPLLAPDPKSERFADTERDIEVDDVRVAPEPRIRDFDAIDPAVPAEEPAVASWNPTAAVPVTESQRFGAVALLLATMVGAIFGFAAGYMARPRALQTNVPQTIATAPGTEREVAPAATAPEASVPTTPAPTAPDPQPLGRLLVRSTPSGATVTVDGVEKGVTPLALRDVELGARDVTVSRRGYVTENRKVQLNSARPSRSIDVRLTTAASAAAQGRSVETAPTRARKSAGGGGQPATGSVIVESRPVGAAILLNGKPTGNTPRTIGELPPGDYRIVLTMPGFRNFTTTVRVVAGERVRAAASLTAQEQE